MDMGNWSHEDAANAQAEGWDIFEASGSMANEHGDRPFQLQSIDEMDALADDMAAWLLVRARAQAGDGRHQRALEFLKTRSPAEYSDIINYVPEQSHP
jgi:hypothetical protein